MKAYEKMRNNIINKTSDFVGIKNEQYCQCQDYCKLLIVANTQYNKVVEQNCSLQQELNKYKSDAEKDNSYLAKIEESNMLLEQDADKYLKIIENISELVVYNETYSKIALRQNLDNIQEIIKPVLNTQKSKE